MLKESAGKEVLNAARAAHAGRRYVSGKIADRCGVDEARGHRAFRPRGVWSGSAPVSERS